MTNEHNNAAQTDWRELCRRLYVELWHCNKQMTGGPRPRWTQGSTVRDVLRDASLALEATPAAAAAPAVPWKVYESQHLRSIVITEPNGIEHEIMSDDIARPRARRLFNRLLEALNSKTPAAPSQPAVPQGEPFGYFRAEPFGWTDCAATDEGAIALYERPAAPAVPQGEPVYQLARATGPVADAWIDVAKDVYDDAGCHPSDFKRRILYAAPSQPVTLTDEEIKRNWSGGACPPWGIKFARAIIAALREKEQA